LACRITPFLEQIAQEYTFNEFEKSIKKRYVDVSTGMRLSYLEWPNTGEDVVLLIHDIAQCADIWRGIGNKLSERGYKVFAIDLRGHGASSWSSEGRYSADLLAEDIHAFIVAKDLYVRPVAVVGTGIGALTALMLACGASALIGAIACLEFGLPPELTAAAEADTFARRIQTLNSIDVLPWWSFWLGQAAEFMSVAECAAFLSSPLANIGPVVLPSLIPTHQSEGASRPLDIGKLMTKQLTKPIKWEDDEKARRAIVEFRNRGLIDF